MAERPNALSAFMGSLASCVVVYDVKQVAFEINNKEVNIRDIVKFLCEE
jgi:hypothetical protein